MNENITRLKLNDPTLVKLIIHGNHNEMEELIYALEFNNTLKILYK